jgi:NitT/TauT family transport system substrate-binding protein
MPRLLLTLLGACLLVAACGPSASAPAGSPPQPPNAGGSAPPPPPNPGGSQAAPSQPPNAGGSPASPTTGSTPGLGGLGGADAAPMTLNVALPAMTAFVWPFVVLKDGPVGAQEHVTVDWTVVETDARAIQALVGGSVDFAEAAMDAVVRAADQGGDLVAVGGNINRPPYALAVRQNVTSYADLKGKKFAVTDLRGGSTVVLKLLLQTNGLREDDYDLQPLGGTPNRYAALANGVVDAAILAQPADFKAQDEGYRILGYTTDQDFQFTTYTIRRSWGQQNPDKVRRFLHAMLAAHHWLHDPANREQAIDLGMQAFRSSRSETERTWDLYFQQNGDRVQPSNVAINMPGADTVVRTLAEGGEIKDASGGASRYVDEHYLQDAQRGS